MTTQAQTVPDTPARPPLGAASGRVVGQAAEEISLPTPAGRLGRFCAGCGGRGFKLQASVSLVSFS